MAGNRSSNWLNISWQPAAAALPSAASGSLSLSSSWHYYDNHELPQSWSHLLLNDLEGEEEKSGLTQMQVKKLENWEENSEVIRYAYHQMLPAPSPKSSCTTSLGSSMLDFSGSNADTGQTPPSDPWSSKCNSTATGGAAKKAKIQASSTQSTFKTDTASVLLEAIGYIRFLQSQIEALSLPYLANGSGSMRQQQQPVHGERNCLFPEDPGQVCHEEAKKDLRSRGLCLVPLSCTLQVGSDNGADYWSSAFIMGGGDF